MLNSFEHTKISEMLQDARNDAFEKGATSEQVTKAFPGLKEKLLKKRGITLEDFDNYQEKEASSKVVILGDKENVGALGETLTNFKEEVRAEDLANKKESIISSAGDSWKQGWAEYLIGGTRGTDILKAIGVKKTKAFVKEILDKVSEQQETGETGVEVDEIAAAIDKLNTFKNEE